MFYITGRIYDQVIVEKTSIVGDVDLNNYKTALATNYGGVSSDYYIYILEDDCNDAKRIKAGDECAYIWENGIITGVDFSIEDNRKLFMIKTVDPNNKEVIKDTIVGDNTDSIIIQTRTCLSDHTVDTSINTSALIPVITPDGRNVYLKSVITNGVGLELIFKSSLEGVWSVIPGNIIIGSEKMRIVGDNGPGATNTINVLLNI